MDPLAHSPTLAATSAQLSGERLAEGVAVGEYVVDRFLGAGAMGEVYAGKHPVIGKRVAIKVLRRDAAGGEAAERMIREARATSAIDHPNVIDIFALGRLDDGRLYLVMDLVDGRSLREAVSAGPLPAGEALSILDAIADALDAAHARGVIHRDLKPDNIMLGNKRVPAPPAEAIERTGATWSRVFVLDFGLAKLVASAHADAPIAPGTLTGQGTWLGTPGYMAPEQWSTDGAGPASDRYALGVIAFELLAGAPPFSAASVPAMMEQHFRAAVPSVSSRGTAHVPAAVDDVLRRAMAKDPAERFATARAMVDALREAIGTTAARRSSSKKLWVPAAAGVGVLGIGVVAVIAMRPGDDPGATKPAAAVARPTDEGAIIVVTTPDTAQVSLDGHVVTSKRLVAKPGTTTSIVVRAPGYGEVQRTLTADAGDKTETVELQPVSRFEGVWRLPDGELRALARQGERVDVFKVDAVTGPRKFFRHYAFVPADKGVAFASDEDMVDPHAPDDPSCHIAVHVEYRYDPAADALELRKDKVKVDFADGHCVVHSHDPETSSLSRVDQARESDVLEPPAGVPITKLQKPVAPKQKKTSVIPLETTGKKPPSPYTKLKSAPTDNLFQGGDKQQAQNAPPNQAQPQAQAPQTQQVEQVQRQKK